MTDAGAFNASKSTFALYGGFFRAVADAIGPEKAVELHGKVAASFDVSLAGLVRSKLGEREFDLETFTAARAEMLAVLGITAEIGRAGDAVTLCVQRCSLYEGLRLAGVDHATVGALCRRGVDQGYAELRRAFPPLCGRLRFRETAEEACGEEFSLRAPGV